MLQALAGLRPGRERGGDGCAAAPTKKLRHRSTVPQLFFHEVDSERGPVYARRGICRQRLDLCSPFGRRGTVNDSGRLVGSRRCGCRGCLGFGLQILIGHPFDGEGVQVVEALEKIPVSYTHLTLPTKRIV